eukprot:2028155-Amphidinium_carterae.1
MMVGAQNTRGEQRLCTSVHMERTIICLEHAQMQWTDCACGNAMHSVAASRTSSKVLECHRKV